MTAEDGAYQPPDRAYVAVNVDLPPPSYQPLCFTSDEHADYLREDQDGWEVTEYRRAELVRFEFAVQVAEHRHKAIAAMDRGDTETAVIHERAGNAIRRAATAVLGEGPVVPTSDAA